MSRIESFPRRCFSTLRQDHHGYDSGFVSICSVILVGFELLPAANAVCSVTVIQEHKQEHLLSVVN